jgi:hypothetical protein
MGMKKKSKKINQLIATINKNTIAKCVRDSFGYMGYQMICQNCVTIQSNDRSSDSCNLCGNVTCRDCEITISPCWNCMSNACNKCRTSCCQLCLVCSKLQKDTTCSECGIESCSCKRQHCRTCKKRVCDKHLKKCQNCFYATHCFEKCSLCEEDFCAPCLVTKCDICEGGKCEYQSCCRKCFDSHKNKIEEEIKRSNPDFERIRELIRNYKL